MIEYEPSIGVPTAHTSVRDAFLWLARELEECGYGEVGLTFTLHAGTVRRIERVERKTMRTDA